MEQDPIYQRYILMKEFPLAPQSNQLHRRLEIISSKLTDEENGNGQRLLRLGSDPPFSREIRDGVAWEGAAHSRVDHCHHACEDDESLLSLFHSTAC